ncbi:mitochondrial iron-sulfur cluster biosynthesis Iba57 (Caf17) [Andalucia godoyi]|uniref:Mitochondrial iron-sulfur cluster biosynthesis Iba57 (Caf17) n=1 Tax=Andalucia godoyi TaxID=505711 RepID=A0A8K0F4I6_ANDGO|nr:mitochondrial iron-sulfur cluster biosynthesis Iba57 (Caf17) [Andalucia godoyi]|eukprot:ANDGO_05675.mRNA.1 mitochondrial iron-sulfur cluster biosynthesis Iba57 (Caf17)
MQRLVNRSIVRVRGADRMRFLQSLLTQDVMPLDSEPLKPVASCFLSAKGRVLCDMLLFNSSSIASNLSSLPAFSAAKPTLDDVGDAVLIDHDAAISDRLVRALSMYRLKSQVQIDVLPSTKYGVFALFDRNDHADNDAMGNDPRLRRLGSRYIAPTSCVAIEARENSYDQHRLGLGVPEGFADLQWDVHTPLEANMDLLHAVSFNKGCYIGQELTARTHYTGVIRKRLFSIQIDPQSLGFIGNQGLEPTTMVGADVVRISDDKKIGSLRSLYGHRGMALLRIEPVLTDPVPAAFGIRIPRDSRPAITIPIHRVIWPDWIPKPDLSSLES